MIDNLFSFSLFLIIEILAGIGEVYMRVSIYKSEIVAGDVKVSAVLTFEESFRFSDGASSAEVWFSWPASYFLPEREIWDPFVMIALPFAMVAGEDLSVEGSIDPVLYLNLLEVISIYHWYFPGKTREVEIKVKVDWSAKVGGANDRVGTFFSGGVDSLFNVADMKRLHKMGVASLVSDLWLVHGMDIRLSDSGLWETTLSELSDMASMEGLDVTPVRTNVREVQRGIIGWTDMGFGSILSAVSKLFSEIVPTALIGSYDLYKYCVPHASSPQLDPFWSCSRQVVRHYTSRVSRMDKIQAIHMNAPGLLSKVRVCWENTDGQYNCGVCEKCLRTQAQLYALGILDDVSSFEGFDLLGNLKGFRLNSSALGNGYTLRFWQEILDVALENSCSDLVRVLSPILKDANRRAHYAAFKRSVKTAIRSGLSH
ncbi:hypothetical protein [Pseudomaricurvus sp. HS19]|uniref:hypothetical protein n=1 Tax=Pseudomaricurvus sp. HS19 TaxID=2692626 RepID=UPI00136F5A52|nr:hypothetical protein [Pseudomaricurvus sp. HS19]MYM62040.1 hypothetical protein [Pseudomaricurvus sp. HS19]